ncbi:MAG: TIGR00730 family Rossman fold protein [Bacteroidota bacterium]
MKNICVFCGSSVGSDPRFVEAAKSLGRQLVSNNIQLIFGGGKVGLMGAIADEVLARGGKAIGVIPDFLMEKEVGHTGLTEMHIVESMHERKQKMAFLADGFIAMPGGFGTLEELAEILTWVQLELIRKPVALLNVNGYYDGLLNQLDHMVECHFLKPQNRELILEIKKIDTAVDQLKNYEFGDFSIWDKLEKM